LTSDHSPYFSTGTDLAPSSQRQGIVSSNSIETRSKLTSIEISTFAKFGQNYSKVITTNSTITSVSFPHEIDQK